MKIRKVSAFEDNQGAIWSTEQEALESNITMCIDAAGFAGGDHYSDTELKLKRWLKNHKSKVRYLLANINKIDLEE